jgi:F0F1-type ATP synthase membrane subunit c/vacuolar-type H+-ATPase subunit K
MLKRGRLCAARCTLLVTARTTIEKFLEGDMLEEQEREAIQKGMQTIWLIWAAIVGTLFIYIFICHFLGGAVRSSEFSESSAQLLRNIFYGVAAFTLIPSFYLRKIFLKVRPRTNDTNIITRTSHVHQPPFVGQYTVAVITSLAMAESIGIYGLILFLLGESFQTLYTFIVVSALAMFFYRPKKEELERLAIAYKKRDESIPEV